MDGTVIDHWQISRVLMPHAMARYEAVKSTNTRFVHYTRADVAVSILADKQVWMRKTSCMNDFM